MHNDNIFLSLFTVGAYPVKINIISGYIITGFQVYIFFQDICLFQFHIIYPAAFYTFYMKVHSGISVKPVFPFTVDKLQGLACPGKYFQIAVYSSLAYLGKPFFYVIIQGIGRGMLFCPAQLLHYYPFLYSHPVLIHNYSYLVIITNNIIFITRSQENTAIIIY